MPRKSLISIIVVAALSVGAVGFFIWRDFTKKSAPPASPAPLAGEAPASPAASLQAGQAAKAMLDQLKTAALERPISAPADLPASAKDQTISELKTLDLQLSRDPNYLQGWLQAGILRKYLGDYKGAELIWKYAALSRPEEPVAFLDLGDLYFHYLKNYPEAEKYFRAVINIKPDYIPTYENLSDLYKFSYKEKSALASEILLEGIKNNPESGDLVIYLADYYRDQNNAAEARKYYEKALTMDIPQGAKAEIENELKNL